MEAYEDCGKGGNIYFLCKICNIVIDISLQNESEDILMQHLGNPMQKQSIDGKVWYDHSKWESIDR